MPTSSFRRQPRLRGRILRSAGIPLAHFADAASKAINAGQEEDLQGSHDDDRSAVVRSRPDGDRHPGRRACTGAVLLFRRPENCGIGASDCNRRGRRVVRAKPDRFLGLGGVTLQQPEIAVRELDYVMSELKLKGVQILTNVDGKELSDPEYRPFFARAEQLGALTGVCCIRIGFTHGELSTRFYFNTCRIGESAGDDACAEYHSIFSGIAGALSDLKLLGTSEWRRISDATLFRTDRPCLGARQDFHADPLPLASDDLSLVRFHLDTRSCSPTTKLAYLLDVSFGRGSHPDEDRLSVLTWRSSNPIGYIAACSRNGS